MYDSPWKTGEPTVDKNLDQLDVGEAVRTSLTKITRKLEKGYVVYQKDNGDVWFNEDGSMDVAKSFKPTWYHGTDYIEEVGEEVGEESDLPLPMSFLLTGLGTLIVLFTLTTVSMW